MSRGRRIGRLRVDLSPLRESRDFQLLFLAARVLPRGRWSPTSPYRWQVYELTVDLAAMVMALPVVLFPALAQDVLSHPVSRLLRRTVWNQTIPDAMRGRLAGIEMLSYSLGPLGGQVRAGVVADVWSVRGSIVSGAGLCVVGVTATALWLRDCWG